MDKTISKRLTVYFEGLSPHYNLKFYEYVLLQKNLFHR